MSYHSTYRCDDRCNCCSDRLQRQTHHVFSSRNSSSNYENLSQLQPYLSYKILIFMMSARILHHYIKRWSVYLPKWEFWLGLNPNPLKKCMHNKCIEDDTKDAARRSPNCIKKQKNRSVERQYLPVTEIL